MDLPDHLAVVVSMVETELLPPSVALHLRAPIDHIKFFIEYSQNHRVLHRHNLTE